MNTIDILAPLGLVGIVLMGVALVMAGRKQKRERGRLFEALAATHGWRYLAIDDGTAQSLAKGFQGFDRFLYPSRAPRLPSSVVVGHVDEGKICLFVHTTETTYLRSWYVCVVEASADFKLSARIHPRSVREPHQRLADPVVGTADPRFDDTFEIRCQAPQELLTLMDARVREVLLDGSGRLPFPVEVQLHENRVAVYLAGRNDDVSSTAELEELVAFTRALVRSLDRGHA